MKTVVSVWPNSWIKGRGDEEIIWDSYWALLSYQLFGQQWSAWSEVLPHKLRLTVTENGAVKLVLWRWSAWSGVLRSNYWDWWCNLPACWLPLSRVARGHIPRRLGSSLRAYTASPQHNLERWRCCSLLGCRFPRRSLRRCLVVDKTLPPSRRWFFSYLPLTKMLQWERKKINN